MSKVRIPSSIEDAIVRAKISGVKENIVREELLNSFVWKETEEGHLFWQIVYELYGAYPNRGKVYFTQKDLIEEELKPKVEAAHEDDIYDIIMQFKNEHPKVYGK